MSQRAPTSSRSGSSRRSRCSGRTAPGGRPGDLRAPRRPWPAPRSGVPSRRRRPGCSAWRRRSGRIWEWSGREDSNLRPPEPHSGALPDCATPRPNSRGAVYDRGPPRRSRVSRQPAAPSTRRAWSRTSARRSVAARSSIGTTRPRYRAGVADRGDGIAQEPMSPRARQGRGAQQPSEFARAHGQQPFDQGHQRHPQRSRVVRLPVDRADLLADVTAEDPVADGGALPSVEHAGVLDREVADTTTGVDGLRGHDGPGRGIRSGSACTTRNSSGPAVYRAAPPT